MFDRFGAIFKRRERTRQNRHHPLVKLSNAQRNARLRFESAGHACGAQACYTFCQILVCTLTIKLYTAAQTPGAIRTKEQ